MSFIRKRFDIDPGLKDVLSHFYHTKLDIGEQPILHHAAPSLEMSVVFNFGKPVPFSLSDKNEDTFNLRRVGIVGPLRKMMDYTLPANSEMLVMNFVYNGFFRLMPVTFAEMQDQTFMLLHEQLEEVWEILNNLASVEEKIYYLTQYLLNTINKNDASVQPLLDGMSEWNNPAINPVKSIASKADITDRSVQMRFKKYAGYSPKELLRFLRFKHVITDIAKVSDTANIDWLNLVYKYNYYDQSHLIKDFKFYTGKSPRQFIKMQQEAIFCMSSV